MSHGCDLIELPQEQGGLEGPLRAWLRWGDALWGAWRLSEFSER